MRIESCRNCGQTLQVLKICKICKQPTEFECSECTKYVDSKFHASCILKSQNVIAC